MKRRSHARRKRVVGATYRLQFSAAFTFDDAAAVVDYLASLGVTHVYCSPYVAAAPGSGHGYDIIDYDRPNPELGGEAGLSRFLAALERAGLGQVIDLVPNHMSIASHENVWWTDVLERGPASRYARHFDVDWQPSDSRFHNAILLPVLADHYGLMLTQRRIRLTREEGRVWVVYESHRFPVAPATLALIFQEGDTIEDAIERANRDPDVLDVLLRAQVYRLARWRVAHRELGYRRFFDVNSLIGLRMERRRVFADTHRLLRHWIASGLIDGIRVDHVDGLRDPQQYLERLRAAAPRAWIVVEKILQSNERLPLAWPVNGTTGYDFSAHVLRLFVDADGHRAVVTGYAAFTGVEADVPARVRDSKLRALHDVLGADVNRLAGLLTEICERHRDYRDYSRHELTEGLCELIAGLDVYRTYVRPAIQPVAPEDRARLERAVAAAVAARQDLEPQLFEFLLALACGEIAGDLEAEFAWRVQQLSGAAMAKGVEDTLFYAFAPFLPLNDVGHEPADSALSVAAFHEYLAGLARQCPATMVTTSTHDSKRSDDVRARLVVLSHRADEWREAVSRWSSWLSRYRSHDQPSRHDEYYFYQTLVGAWPISVERLQGHMQKAAREARTSTSWTSPDAGYEAALRGFVSSALGDQRFMNDCAAFVEPMVGAGRVISLAIGLIRSTAVGVPDLYQGSEIWKLQLADPDNRGAVDYPRLRQALAAATTSMPSAAMQLDEDGLTKIWVIHQALRLRQRRPAAFDASASCEALSVRGGRAAQVLAYCRGNDVAVVAPTRTWDPVSTWEGTTVHLPTGRWQNVLTDQETVGGPIALVDLWKAFPVTLLERVAE